MRESRGRAKKLRGKEKGTGEEGKMGTEQATDNHGSIWKAAMTGRSDSGMKLTGLCPWDRHISHSVHAREVRARAGRGAREAQPGADLLRLPDRFVPSGG